MAKPDVWMPLYIGDYLSDTMHLTTEQHGAYLLLIMAYWKNGGPLPASPTQLAAICRMPVDAWSIAQAVLENFFEVTSDGKWLSKRVEKEMHAAGQKKAKASQKAANAAAARWDKISVDAPSITQAMPEHMLEECPSPSPSPLKDKDQKHCDQQAESRAKSVPFERIRTIYNEVCSGTLPEALKLDKKRQSNIRKCWSMEVSGVQPFRSADFWKQYFTDCLADPHWTGTNDRGWRADLEFLTRETSVLKVLERA